MAFWSVFISSPQEHAYDSPVSGSATNPNSRRAGARSPVPGPRPQPRPPAPPPRAPAHRKPYRMSRRQERTMPLEAACFISYRHRKVTAVIDLVRAIRDELREQLSILINEEPFLDDT